MNPDIGVVLGGALRDTWPALRSWLGWLIALLVISTASVFVMFANAPGPMIMTDAPPQDPNPLFVVSTLVLSVAMFAAVLFMLASGIRTVRPDFAMTAGKFFGFLGYAILAGLLILVGFLALIIPGFYVSVKLQFAPYMYLLGEREPLAASWRKTKGRFWLTLGVVLLVGIIAEVAIYAAMIPAYIIALVAGKNVALYIVAAPIVAAAFFLAVQFEYNAFARYADALMQADAPLAVQNSVS